MRITKARVRNYRSIKDSGWFDVERDKTILVGSNEAGKTAIMRALEHLKPGPVVPPFTALRDFPRSEYHRIQSGELDPKTLVVVAAEYALDEDEKEHVRRIAPGFEDCTYLRRTYLDNHREHGIEDVPSREPLRNHRDEFRRLAAHADVRMVRTYDVDEFQSRPSELLAAIMSSLSDEDILNVSVAAELRHWLDHSAALYIDLEDESWTASLDSLRSFAESPKKEDAVLEYLASRVPVMVYHSHYTRVQPMFHLGNLATMLESGTVDPTDSFAFGNSCLLRLLGFSARQLSELGKAKEPAADDPAAMQKYRDKLDERSYRLNAASRRLTGEIKAVWDTGSNIQGGAGAGTEYALRVLADQQYLKVVVEDSLGVEVELDQRSEGFQWLVSFFIVFFAQTSGEHVNAILLLDEPGLSLHGLKQREFRHTLSRLAINNQLMFTTHSPFLVGSDELDIVRVVDMVDRAVGTRIHNDVVADDPASLLPLQEALGYDMAQSMFSEQQSLVLQSLTDYWYLESVASLLREAGTVDLDETIALVPAGSAQKLVYFATILHAHSLKVAALMGSDVGEADATRQEVLVHKLGKQSIVRTTDAYAGGVSHPGIEDLLRETLVDIAQHELDWNVGTATESQPDRSVVDLIESEIGADFSKNKLAKAFVRWTRDHSASDLTARERVQWTTLIRLINNVFDEDSNS